MARTPPRRPGLPGPDDGGRARRRPGLGGASSSTAATVAGDYDDPDTFVRLRRQLDDLDEELGRPGNRTYYLATIPAMFDHVAGGLGAVGLNQPRSRMARRSAW